MYLKKLMSYSMILCWNAPAYISHHWRLTPGTHQRRKRREASFSVRAAASLSTPDAHFSALVNKLLCSSAPFPSNIELCVCVCVCVCLSVCLCRSLLTDRCIRRQDNHTIIKQGVLFWHLFYFENWLDSLCLFSVWLPVWYNLLSSPLFSLTKSLAAHGKNRTDADTIAAERFTLPQQAVWTVRLDYMGAEWKLDLSRSYSRHDRIQCVLAVTHYQWSWACSEEWMIKNIASISRKEPPQQGAWVHL